METMDKSYEGLPGGAQVLGEINSTNELEIGKAYFNQRNGKLGVFLGKAISPDNLDGPPMLLWQENDSVSGEPIARGGDEEAFSLPLVHVKLPYGFFKFERMPEA